MSAGFTAVFEMMRECNKPAVGHNLSFDLTFCLSSFAQTLPPTWTAYKQLVQQWFPAGVWDTKHLARQLQVQLPTECACADSASLHSALILHISAVILLCVTKKLDPCMAQGRCKG